MRVLTFVVAVGVTVGCGLAFARTQAGWFSISSAGTGQSSEQVASGTRSSTNLRLDFRPSRDGFRFRNSFSGYPLPCKAPEWLDLGESVPSKFGLCGGMSLRAARRYASRLPRPADDTPPAHGSDLYRELYEAQVESLGPALAHVVTFGTWSLLPDIGELGVRSLTADSIDEVVGHLRSGRLVVLGLVISSTTSKQAIWNNHQVLAYGFSLRASSSTSGTMSGSGAETIVFSVYDPNAPGDDRAELRFVVRTDSGLFEDYRAAKGVLWCNGVETPFRGMFPIMTVDDRAAETTGPKPPR